MKFPTRYLSLMSGLFFDIEFLYILQLTIPLKLCHKLFISILTIGLVMTAAK